MVSYILRSVASTSKRLYLGIRIGWKWGILEILAFHELHCFRILKHQAGEFSEILSSIHEKSTIGEGMLYLGN